MWLLRKIDFLIIFLFLDFHHIFSSILFIFYHFCRIMKFSDFPIFQLRSFLVIFSYLFQFFVSFIHSNTQTHMKSKFHSLKEFTLSFSLFNYFNRGLMPYITTTTPTMTRHTFNSNHSNNPMISSPLFPRKTLDASAIPISPRFSRRPFPNKASPGL